MEQLKQQQAQLDAGKAMMSEDQIAQAQGQIDAAYAALDEAKNTLDRIYKIQGQQKAGRNQLGGEKFGGGTH